MAATPGTVVYRSDLIELIQYEPQTKRVHEVPLLFCPPWINKYYIMDLAPGKSLIEWAVQPRPHLLRHQLPQPRRVDARRSTSTTTCTRARSTRCASSREITGAAEVNTLSVCLGGTLTAIGLAHNAADRRHARSSRPRSSTPTPTSARPARSAYSPTRRTSPASRSRWPRRATSTPDQMAHTFDALRANDLVFRYVVNNWLLGKKPPAFDLLVWNNDSTRMPAKMHSRVPALVLPEQRVRPGRVRGRRQQARPGARSTSTPTCSRPSTTTSCRGLRLQDHPAARRAQPLRAQHLRATSPASSTRRAPRPSTGPTTTLPADPQEWKADAELQDGTWWEDWAHGSPSGAARRSPPARLGSEEHPPIEAAPGSYVRTQRMRPVTPGRAILRLQQLVASAGSDVRVRVDRRRCPAAAAQRPDPPAGELGRRSPSTARSHRGHLRRARRRWELNTVPAPLDFDACDARLRVLDEAGLDRADVLGSPTEAPSPSSSRPAPARVVRLGARRRPRAVSARPPAPSDECPASAGGALLAAPGHRRHAVAFARRLKWSSVPFLGATDPTLVVCGSRDRVVPPRTAGCSRDGSPTRTCPAVRRSRPSAAGRSPAAHRRGRGVPSGPHRGHAQLSGPSRHVRRHRRPPVTWYRVAMVRSLRVTSVRAGRNSSTASVSSRAAPGREGRDRRPTGEWGAGDPAREQPPCSREG